MIFLLSEGRVQWTQFEEVGTEGRSWFLRRNPGLPPAPPPIREADTRVQAGKRPSGEWEAGGAPGGRELGEAGTARRLCLRVCPILCVGSVSN